MKKNIFEFLGGDLKKKSMLPSVLTPQANKINNLKNIRFSLSLIDHAILNKYTQDLPEFLGMLIHFGLDYFILDEHMCPILLQDSSVLKILYQESLKENMDRKELVGWTSFNSLKSLLTILDKMERENQLLPSEDLEKAMSILVITSYIILTTLDINYIFFKRQLVKSDIFSLNILNMQEKLVDKNFKHLSLKKPEPKTKSKNTSEKQKENFEITDEMAKESIPDEVLVITGFGSLSEPYLNNQSPSELDEKEILIG